MTDSWNTLLEAVEGLDENIRPRFANWLANDALPELFDAGVQLIVDDGPAVEGCGGFFTDDPETVLAIAVGNSTWPATFVHEFSHYEQYADNSEVWYAGTLEDGTHGSDLVELWYGHHIELNAEQQRKYFDPMLAVEVDAERRSVQTIIDLDLPFDVEDYSRQAASYLYLYPELMRRRSWITVGRAPYRAPEILEVMPRTLDGNFTMDPLPENLQALYDTCFEEGEPLD